MFTSIWQTKTNITINKGGKSFAIENYVNLTRVREREREMEKKNCCTNSL